MRKRSPALFGMLLLAASMTSCFAGPHQLRRSIDDWDHKTYVNSPWFNATLWIVPVIPTCHVLAWTFDFLVCDAYAFWFDDAWDGAGTGFQHADPPWTDGHVGSLLLDRTEWTRVDK
ncbi:MAG TPA: hypothetical protein VF384_01890 [Planctomycetota bacterium]